MVSNLRLLNPDYEYLFFDDQAVDCFIAQEFPQYKAVFESFRFRIQRYDFFRYLVIYKYGGFYFDLDDASRYWYIHLPTFSLRSVLPLHVATTL